MYLHRIHMVKIYKNVHVDRVNSLLFGVRVVEVAIFC